MSVKDFLISPTSEMIKDSTLDDIEFNDEGKEGEMADNDEDEEPYLTIKQYVIYILIHIPFNPIKVVGSDQR